MARKISDSKLISSFMKASETRRKSADYSRKTAFASRFEEVQAIESYKSAQRIEDDLWNEVCNRKLARQVMKLQDQARATLTTEGGK